MILLQSPAPPSSSLFHDAKSNVSFGRQNAAFYKKKTQGPSRLKFQFQFSGSKRLLFVRVLADWNFDLNFRGKRLLFVRYLSDSWQMPQSGNTLSESRCPIKENKWKSRRTKFLRGGMGWFEEESRSGLGLEMWPIVNKPSLPWTNRILTLTILRKVFGVRCVKNFMIQIVFDFAIFNDGAIIMMH